MIHVAYDRTVGDSYDQGKETVRGIYWSGERLVAWGKLVNWESTFKIFFQICDLYRSTIPQFFMPLNPKFIKFFNKWFISQKKKDTAQR
jgi:hypothetical protein